MYSEYSDLFPTSLCGVLGFRLDPAAPLLVPAAPAAPAAPAPPAAPAAPAAPSSQITPPSSNHTSLITAPLLITTHQLITAQLITAPLLTPHFSHLPYYILTSHITYHITTHHSSTSPWSADCLSRGRCSSSQLITAPHTSSTHMFENCGCLRVAGAVHRASWRSCGAPGRRWGRGCFSRGRRSTQSVLEELRRVWPPLGPWLPFAWRVHRATGRAAACVAAAGAAAAFCVAGAVHRPPLGQAQYTELAWQAQYTEPPGGAAAFRVAGAVHAQSLLDDLRAKAKPGAASAPTAPLFAFSNLVPSSEVVRIIIYIYIYISILLYIYIYSLSALHDFASGPWTGASVHEPTRPPRRVLSFFLVPAPRPSSIPLQRSVACRPGLSEKANRPPSLGEWTSEGGGGAGPSAFLCVSFLHRLPSRMHVLPSAFVTQAAFRWRPNYLSNKARGQVITPKILETGPFLLLRLLLPASEERNRKAHAANGNTAMACAWCPQTALYVHTCTVASWYHPVYPSLIPGRIAAPATRLGPIRQLCISTAHSIYK